MLNFAQGIVAVCCRQRRLRRLRSSLPLMMHLTIIVADGGITVTQAISAEGCAQPVFKYLGLFKAGGINIFCCGATEEPL